MFHHWTWRVRDVPTLEIGFKHAPPLDAECKRYKYSPPDKFAHLWGVYRKFKVWG